MELFMCSVKQREGYGEAFRWLSNYLWKKSKRNKSVYLLAFYNMFSTVIDGVLYDSFFPLSFIFIAFCIYINFIQK